MLVGDMLVNFGNILSETSKSSACWDMSGNSHLIQAPASDSSLVAFDEESAVCESMFPPNMADKSLSALVDGTGTRV